MLYVDRPLTFRFAARRKAGREKNSTKAVECVDELFESIRIGKGGRRGFPTTRCSTLFPAPEAGDKSDFWGVWKSLAAGKGDGPLLVSLNRMIADVHYMRPYFRYNRWTTEDAADVQLCDDPGRNQQSVVVRLYQRWEEWFAFEKHRELCGSTTKCVLTLAGGRTDYLTGPA